MSLNFEKYAAKANAMIREVAFEMGDDYDIEKATRILRAVLHALRNRITVEESMELIAQLPMYIKALYVDGWKVNKKQEHIRHIDDFLDEVYMESSKFGFFDFPTNNSILTAVKAVFRVIRKHVSDGEINDVVSVLPKELKRLWEVEEVEEIKVN
jgi:uncharacterized protein (DUF2267 family)